MRVNIKLVLLILLVILESVGVLAIGVWREYFWESVSNHQLTKFIYYLVIFSGVALVLCFISGYYQYLINLLTLEYRTKYTNIAFLSDHHLVEGGSQRVQEDCYLYPAGSLNLGVGAFRSILSLIIFIYLILQHLSPIYLLFPFIYAIISTGIGGLIARPLIQINYDNQVKEAGFRQGLTKMNYESVLQNNRLLFRKTKYLNYFQNFYNQITVIVPYVILAPLYFTFKITFGVLMQQANAIAEIVNSLSYLINSFSDINRWLSCRKRLKELKII